MTKSMSNVRGVLDPDGKRWRIRRNDKVTGNFCGYVRGGPFATSEVKGKIAWLRAIDPDAPNTDHIAEEIQE